LFLEDLPFNVKFDLSSFKMKSKNVLDETILDPDFIADLEVQKANRSLDEYILNPPYHPLILF